MAHLIRRSGTKGKDLTNGRRLVFAVSLFICLVHVSCAIPRLIWPQDDIQTYEMNAPSLKNRVLVASRSSAFKDSVVARIREAFAEEPVHFKFIGLGELKHENAGAYKVVVLINTCIAWGMDPDVEGFLKESTDQSHIIVLTTSGDGNWLPKMQGRDFDAIASASKSIDVDHVAAEIISKITALLSET
jgi:hypothetical protein